MAEAAREVIGIVDSSKWGRAAFATFCRTEDLSAVVTDDAAPASTVTVLRSRGVDVRLAPVKGQQEVRARTSPVDR
jgi:DeoR/GlpR family transcriptional regulator of sugar metabolism